MFKEAEAPKHCDNCCSVNIELTTNDRIYGKIHGEWPLIYFCNDCRAAVGCHNGTEIPLGRMADRSTRQLRIKAHAEFDQLWKSGYMSRSKAYNWLASLLQIDPTQCHISLLSKDQLKDVITLSSDYIARNLNALEKRKAKNDEKRRKQNERDQAEQRRTSEFIKRRKTKRKP